MIARIVDAHTLNRFLDRLDQLDCAAATIRASAIDMACSVAAGADDTLYRDLRRRCTDARLYDVSPVTTLSADVRRAIGGAQ